MCFAHRTRMLPYLNWSQLYWSFAHFLPVQSYWKFASSVKISWPPNFLLVMASAHWNCFLHLYSGVTRNVARWWSMLLIVVEWSAVNLHQFKIRCFHDIDFLDWWITARHLGQQIKCWPVFRQGNQNELLSCWMHELLISLSCLTWLLLIIHMQCLQYLLPLLNINLLLWSRWGCFEKLHVHEVYINFLCISNKKTALTCMLCARLKLCWVLE